MELKAESKSVSNAPEGWVMVDLASVAKRITRGASPRPIDSPIWFDKHSKVGWVRISDVTSSRRYLFETTQKLSKLGVKHSRYVPAGSLIMSICATVGRPIETQIDTCIHDGFVVFEQPSIDQSFLYYVLQSLESKWAESGQTGSQMNLNTGLINSRLVLIPNSLSEQQSIAAALFDVDELLHSLDKNILKKQNLKQAAMQQLLAKKIRLPGFSGEWKKLNLKDHATLKARIGWQALTTDEYLDFGEYYLVTGTDFIDGRVNWASCHFVSEERFSQDENIQLVERDVLVTKDGTIGKVGFVENLAGQATLNSGVFVIRPKKRSFDPLFLFYILRSSFFKDFIAEISAGSTITHLYQKDFINFEFNAPDIEEQIAIAAILSDMDKELSALEVCRKKTELIKHGMMQELVTGKTRLS